MASMAAVACPLCAATFPSEAQLIEHCGGFLPEPDEEPYYCSCGSTFCSPQSLAGHCETTGHAPEGAEAFEDGAYGDYSGGDGDGAVAVAEDGSCVCPMCGAQFTSKAALVSHCGGEEPRVGEEPHWCSCGRAFCSARALVAHAEALGHEAEEPVYEDDGDGDYEALSRLDDENYKWALGRGQGRARRAAPRVAPRGPDHEGRAARGRARGRTRLRPRVRAGHAHAVVRVEPHLPRLPPGDRGVIRCLERTRRRRSHTHHIS